MIAKKRSDVKLENNLECNDQTSHKIRDKKFVKNLESKVNKYNASSAQPKWTIEKESHISAKSYTLSKVIYIFQCHRETRLKSQLKHNKPIKRTLKPRCPKAIIFATEISSVYVLTEREKMLWKNFIHFLRFLTLLHKTRAQIC